MMPIVQDTHVVRIVFEDQPLFMPPPIRGYTILATGQSLEGVSRYVEGGGNLTSTMLAGNISGMVQLDEPGSPLSVSGGWQSPRCSVLLEVVVRFTDGTSSMYRFRCYTDRVDFTASGIPAHDLTLFVNNMEEIKLQGMTGVGIKSARQVYYESVDPGWNTQESVWTVRPADVLVDVTHTKVMAADRVRTPGFDDVQHTSVVSTLNQVPKALNMQLAPAPTWLATILNSYINASSELNSGVNLATPLGGAIASVSQDDMYVNPFVAVLARAVNSITTTLGSFRYSDLCAAEPTLAGDQQRNIHVTNGFTSVESENMMSLGLETTIAQTVATSVRSWMYTSCINAVSFSATNMTTNSETIVKFLDAVAMLSTVTPQAKEGLMNTFINNVKTILIPQISQNGVIDVSITVQASHSSATVVVVTLGTSYPRRYSFPAFMDNTFSPILSHQNQSAIGQSAEAIFDAIDIGRARTTTSAPIYIPEQYTAIATPMQPQYVQPHHPVQAQPIREPDPLDGFFF